MSRLRNRMVKAEFWTDPELLRWPLAKRVFYQGLWALAEDSGCLEDDPFSWKLQLFPSPLDADIGLDTLSKWRGELVKAGKLIAYKADGKGHLYIRTFHQHEHPRNPQRPMLPMPKWLLCESIEGTAKDGKRWAKTVYRDPKNTLPGVKRLRTDSVQTPPGTSSPAPPRVPKGTKGRGVDRGHGHGDTSPVLSEPAQGNGNERTCWRCGGTITGDELLDGNCVDSRNGLRHATCGAKTSTKAVHNGADDQFQDAAEPEAIDPPATNMATCDYSQTSKLPSTSKDRASEPVRIGTTLPPIERSEEEAS